MKRFMIKDLMIDVGVAEAKLEAAEGILCVPFDTFEPCPGTSKICAYPTKLCAYPTKLCAYPTCHFITWDLCRVLQTTKTIIMCEAQSRPIIEDPREWYVLEEWLQTAQQAVHAATEAVAGEMIPGTLEEVNLLRGKLQEAMAELDAIEKEMG